MVTAERPTYLSKVLTQYRIANNMNQDEVAKYLGVTRSAYSYYELGKTEPNTENLMVLAKLYNVSLSEFFPPEKTFSYLLSDSKYPNSSEPRPTNMGQLTDDERKLISLFRLSDNKDRTKAIDALKKPIK